MMSTITPSSVYLSNYTHKEILIMGLTLKRAIVRIVAPNALLFLQKINVHLATLKIKRATANQAL